MKNKSYSRFQRATILSMLGTAFTLTTSAVVAQPLVNPFTGKPIQQPAPPAQATAPPSKPASPPSLPPATPNASPAAPESPSSGVQLQNTPNPGVTLKFDNADIYDVIQVVLGDILKLDYVIDPSVQGRITIKSTGAISMADIFNTLETALSTSNISILKQGKVYKVVRDANAVRDTFSGPPTGLASPVMQIIPLKFVQANQLVNTLRNFIGPQAAITNDPSNRHLIVFDRAANVEKIIGMVKTLDTDYLSQVQIKLIPLTNGEAADLAKELEGIFKTSGILNWTGTEATKVYFLPVARMNALLVATSNDRLMQAAEQWIKTLDSTPRNGLGSFVHIYPVANSNAPHLASMLTQIFGGQASSGPQNQGASALPSAGSSSFGSTGAGVGGGMGSTQNQNIGAQNTATRTIERGSVPSSSGAASSANGLSGSVSVIADEVSNTLIIRASSQDYFEIKKVIERLDTVPKQVMVQVMVAEVTLNDTLQYGVEWWIKSALSSGGKSWPGFVGLDGSIAPQITQTGVGATPSVMGKSSGLNYAVFGSAGQVIGMLNLLGQDTDVNVLSTPHVLASDGKIAKIEVGNEVPVITQTISTPTSGLTTGSNFSTSNSVQYRPTGILLEVKPSITSSGRVTLSISQEVSSVGNPVSAGGAEYPSFQKRKVTTDATIEDGKTIMLAGLIEDRGNDTVTGVPGLKDVPIFGGLFGTTRKNRNKTELLITITPYIVTTREEGDRLAGSFQESLQKLGTLLQASPVPDLGRTAEAKGPQAARPSPIPEQLGTPK
jgi:general secretion pathway protein D